MKKIIYISGWTVLGILLSFIAHALAEKYYIEYALDRGIVLANQKPFGGYCVLPLWFSYGLSLLGIAGGFFTGRSIWNRCFSRMSAA